MTRFNDLAIVVAVLLGAGCLSQTPSTPAVAAKPAAPAPPSPYTIKIRASDRGYTVTEVYNRRTNKTHLVLWHRDLVTDSESMIKLEEW